MKISDWWREKAEAMSEGCPLSECGFDHRATYNPGIAAVQIKELKALFGELPDIKDSEFMDPLSIEDGYSNIFLVHLYFYMRITNNHPGPIEKILEIGGGYGSLARIFKTLHPEIEYTILDLPESLVMSCGFLSDHELKVSLVPIDSMDVLKGESFDVVINTFSFQEMPEETVREYLKFIENELYVSALYSCNYYANRKASAEQSFDGLLPFGSGWEVQLEKYNPPIITVDSPKNFAEFYLKRRSI